MFNLFGYKFTQCLRVERMPYFPKDLSIFVVNRMITYEPNTIIWHNDKSYMHYDALC